MPSFICRYGGDEFILIVHPVELGEVEQLILEIREEINRQETNYPLSVSVGYETFSDADRSIQECIVRADQKLYKDKKRFRIRFDQRK
jgi:diguanylate cyclase (GGDEF)-like protein